MSLTPLGSSGGRDDDGDDETGIPGLEMACALCEERYDGWGLTLNVILTQTSQHRDPAWLTLKSHLGVTSLIDIQRRDKTGHFSSNGFCPFFVLFLMDKVFKVMSRTGL